MTIERAELSALVMLTRVPGLGSTKIRLMIQRFGSALRALEADPQELPGLSQAIISALVDARRSHPRDRYLLEAEQVGIDLIAYTDSRYPKRLLEIADYPMVLYAQGQFLPKDTQSIAVVGTRTASLYGREMARRFGHDLAGFGFTVISGLARGIDTEAHLGALETGRTIAVIGSGLGNIYPAENRLLANQIASQGVVLSEFPIETPPDRQNFPQRNRIVSAMSVATVLIEAPTKSGAILTMERAEAQKRPLFALPGRVDMESYKGNHLLLKSGRAQLVENAADVANALSSLFPVGCLPPAIATDHPRLEREEQELLSQMPVQEITIEELAQLSGLPAVKLNVLLMSLVLKKRVKEYPGKVFKKN